MNTFRHIKKKLGIRRVELKLDLWSYKIRSYVNRTSSQNDGRNKKIESNGWLKSILKAKHRTFKIVSSNFENLMNVIVHLMFSRILL